MSVNYVDKTTGDLIRVAGQGKAEYGASTVRKGTINITEIPAASTKCVPITFDTPMPDSNYEVILSPDNWVIQATERSLGKTANGFYVNAFNSYGAAQDAVITYYAFKLYTDTEYNNLLNNAVLKSDVTDSVTNGDMNPVTSNAVYDVMDASKPLLVLTGVTFDEIGQALITPPAGYKPISAMMTDTNWGFDVCYYQDKYFVVSRNLTEYNRRITNESIAIWIAYIKA